MFLQSEKLNQIFSPLPFHTLKKCFKVLEKGVHKNLILIFLWLKIGALRVKMKGETLRNIFLNWLLRKVALFYV